MAIEGYVWRKNEWDLPSWTTTETEDFDVIIVTTATSYPEDSDMPTDSVETTFMASPTQSSYDSDSDDDDTQTGPPSTWPVGPPTSRLHPPWGPAAQMTWQTSTSTTPTTTTPYAEAQETLSSSVTDSPLATDTDTDTVSSSPISPHAGRPPGWGSEKHANNAPLYAAAAVVPIVLLVIIGVVTVVCLRRRRKRRVEAAVGTVAEEMKMQPHQDVVQAYIAPLAPSPPVVSVSRAYTASPNHLPPTSTSSEFQPIILGPIGSSSNGAYLTGMDTSDMVSINSNSQGLGNPFSDNSSLTEPPPPYRPHSSAPPSFTTNSRHSSLRAPATPHIIERSPFDDPDNDTVSEVSGPALGRDDDTVSMMSDMSYQREPYSRRYSP
ncbi:hypothetical protein DDE83_004613 [Stemphylium lycopersici]|uniref:Uncharacterized protein n=1 Tax=Stemphylium lycopersici TaxID=183478 RepID=A0A364N4E1_STELY|nr:hypothetical protein DDE83_004613 [Stemphylium lycopersici]